MTKTTPARWAPHWETIEGVVYMTETGDAIHSGRQQVGYSETRDENGKLLTGDISETRTSMNSVELNGSDESNFIWLEKDAESTVYASGGNDTLYGGDGHDFLFGGKGTDIMFGGSGDDIFYLKDAFDPSTGHFKTTIDTADKIMDFQKGNDKIRVGAKEDVIYQNVTVGDDDVYTLILGLKEDGGSHVRGIIDGNLDLERSDFKNARSITEIEAVSIEAWPDDANDLNNLDFVPVGDAHIM